MKFTPQTVILSFDNEKEQQDLQKQRNDFNVLISKDLLFIKEKQKEVNKNRREVKKLTYKLDEYKQKDLFTLSNNSSSSSSSSLLDPNERPQNWTEKQMRDFITDKIINDRSSLLITNGNEQEIKLMNRDTINKKLAEFRKLQALRKNYYDIKTVTKYYIPNMFNVDDDKRPTYTVAVPWYAEDCYDFIEYSAFDQMVYYSLTCSYDMIPNPHLREEGNKISIDPHSLVKYSSSFEPHKNSGWYLNQKVKIDLNQKPPSLDH
jgi:hypothetical protein